jgi:RND family efflux transporter MFP subunit
MTRLLRSRWSLAALVTLVLGSAAVALGARRTGGAEPQLTAYVARGDFRVLVTTAGELRARSFVQITAPPNADRAGAYQMKIAKLVPEGTLVREGDFVAELDRSQLANQLNNVNLSLAKAEAVAEQARLDTTLNLSKAREDLRNMEVGLEEKRIQKELNRYEAPSVQRQAQIDYERAERAFTQAKSDYGIKTEQAMAKMREVSTDLDRWRMQQQMIQTVMEGFTIKAPADGMVIYIKEWNGRKKGVGGQVSMWDGGGVATLPDLTQMESLTYVNEIDVRRVAVGQKVALSLDSDPSKRLSGTIVAVANVGEERPNSDAKVFEVKIEVAEADTTLRPGMTTSNAIETMAIPDVLFVPLEAVTSEDDVPFVYKRVGGRIIKQEVETGAMNDTHVVIARGLDEGDVVLLVPPPDAARLTANRLPDSKAGAPPTTDVPAPNTVPVKSGDSK